MAWPGTSHETRTGHRPGPPNTTLYTYRFCIFVLFRAPALDQVPGPPAFIITICPGLSRVRVPGCPGAGPVTVFRVVPGRFLHFGFLGLHFLSFWPFGPLFPFILALWAFISFHFGLLGLHFLSFWPFGLSFWPIGPSFPFILAFWAFILANWAFISFHFGLLGLHFFSFWPFGPSFSFILAFWAFISFHFCLSGLPREAPPASCQKRLVS